MKIPEFESNTRVNEVLYNLYLKHKIYIMIMIMIMKAHWKKCFSTLVLCGTKTSKQKHLLIKKYLFIYLRSIHVKSLL